MAVDEPTTATVRAGHSLRTRRAKKLAMLSLARAEGCFCRHARCERAMTNPEMAKKMSTPRLPPGSHEGSRW